MGEKSQAKKSRKLRRKWIPIIKNLLSTAADITGDWVLYTRVINSDYALDLAPWLLAFSVISSILGGFTLTSLLMNNWSVCVNMHNTHKRRFQYIVNLALLSEMFIEDIPQFILSYLVISKKNDGVLGPYAIFNITTSSFNFVFNALDMMIPLDEEYYEEIEVEDDKDEFAES